MSVATSNPRWAPPPEPSTDAGAGASHEWRRRVWACLLNRDPDKAVEAADLQISSEAGHGILREGVTGRVLAPLAELLEVGPTQLAPVIGVDRATARRYASSDQPLPTHSAETVLRLAELEAAAQDIFASDEAAHAWLKAVHPLLDESPISAASTSYGAQRVREILVALKYGGVV